jgi:hypothetical protein
MYQVIGKQWFDKVNGNSYCSVRIYQNGELICALPFTYGYDNYYLQYAREALVVLGLISSAKRWGYTELFNQQELIKGCKKRDVKAWGKE